jgi:hypothetical protein
MRKTIDAADAKWSIAGLAAAIISAFSALARAGAIGEGDT